MLHRLLSDEVGESVAELMRQARRAHEAWHRRNDPREGLRERKRRLTRQLISDAATAMFAIRGFDNVRVAEVADRVGVSEKTVYNYFPTKESLVLDTADETIERVASALRERRPDESLTEAVVRALKEDMERFEQAPDELIAFTPSFGEMIRLHARTSCSVAGGTRQARGRRPRRAGGARPGRPREPRADDRGARAGRARRRWDSTLATGTSARGCAAKRSATR